MAAMQIDFEGAEFERTVHDHARYLGLDPERHPQLLWIAVEALTAKIPSDWQVAATNNGSAYFYNTHTRETMWEHPLDEKFRSMVREQLSKLGESSPHTMSKSLSSRQSKGGQRKKRSKSRRQHYERANNVDSQEKDSTGQSHTTTDVECDTDGSSQSSLSQSERDAIIELEDRLMQEVAQGKILQDQLDHEQTLNRQYQAHKAETDVTILELRGELSEQQSSLMASQNGEENQANQTRVLQGHLSDEQQKSLQLQENLSAASADVRYLQSTMSVLENQVKSLENRCRSLEEECAEARQQAHKAINLETITATQNEILSQKNKDLTHLHDRLAQGLTTGVPGGPASHVLQRAHSARQDILNQELGKQQVLLEGRANKLEHDLLAARNHLQEARDKNASLKSDLMRARFDLQTKTHQVEQLRDEVKVFAGEGTMPDKLSPGSPSLAAIHTISQNITDIMNNAKVKRQDAEQFDNNQRLQTKYDRLKAQYEILDNRHNEMEDLLRKTNHDAQLAKAKFRQELDDARHAAASMTSEDKRVIAKSRAKLNRQRKQLQAEAADVSKIRIEADQLVREAEMFTEVRSNNFEARIKDLQKDLLTAKQQLRDARETIALKEEKTKMYIRHAVRETAAKVELKFQKKIAKLRRRNSELQRLHSNTAAAAAQMLASPIVSSASGVIGPPRGIHAVPSSPAHYNPHTLHQQSPQIHYSPSHPHPGYYGNQHKNVGKRWP